MKLVFTALRLGARLAPACDIVGISTRTWQRWCAHPEVEDRRKGPKSAPAHKLSKAEEQEVLALINAPEYRNLSPEQIVAKAAEKGIYVASERTIRRILKRHRLDAHRERSKPAQNRRPHELVATRPLEVVTWDITFLKHRDIRGAYFYLYLFEDVWSREVVAYEVSEVQCSEVSASLLHDLCARHNIPPDTLTLHADNGGPMKGATMLAKLQELGVAKSFNRPGVSNDNPYVESLFRHLKYFPTYPTRGFESVEAAREWVEGFVAWYNNVHLHSAIGYVTPADRAVGQDVALLDARRATYEQARSRNPRRWTGNTRPWDRPTVVYLNPERSTLAELRRAKKAA